MSRLDIYILFPDYLEEGKPCFIEVTEDNNEKMDQNAKKELMVSNLKGEAIKKKVLHKEKRDLWGASLVVPRPTSCLPVCKLLSPSASVVPKSSTLSPSALPTLSMSAVPIPGSSAPFAST